MSKKFIIIVFLILSAGFIYPGCEKQTNTYLEVSTVSAVDITETTARVGGTVICKNLRVSEMGVCWGMDTAPSINDSRIIIVPSISEGDTLKFDAMISGLTSKTNYWFRAYANCGDKTIYGESLGLCTCK